MTDSTYSERQRRLETGLAELGDLAVAFSGGVDSSVLLFAAVGALGDRAAGVIADSPSLPRADLVEARRFAATIGARLQVIPTDELDSEDYTRNDGRRCYHCKRTLFLAMGEWAARHGFRNLAFGEIVDDLADERPGRVAARELAVVAPLADSGFTKEDVRRYAREHSLPTAEKPAAACLASRLPLGTPVTAARLARIEEAEVALRELGLRVLRVRDHGAKARVEVGPAELERARSLQPVLASRLASLGFDELELDAYRTPGAALVAE